VFFEGSTIDSGFFCAQATGKQSTPKHKTSSKNLVVFITINLGVKL
jgi:hypothetical protein